MSAERDQSNDLFYSFYDGASAGNPSETASFGDEVRSRNRARIANSQDTVPTVNKRINAGNKTHSEVLSEK